MLTSNRDSSLVEIDDNVIIPEGVPVPTLRTTNQNFSLKNKNEVFSLLHFQSRSIRFLRHTYDDQ